MTEPWELLGEAARPRPLPPDLRARLEATLTGEDSPLVGADDPRPMPPELRQRLEARLTRRGPVQFILGIAAAVLLVVVGLAAAVVRDASEGASVASGPKRSDAPSVATGGDTSGPDGSTGSTGPAAGVATGGSSDAGTAAGSAPPAGDGGQPGSAPAEATGGGAPASDALMGGAPPLRIAYVAGDPQQEAGLAEAIAAANAGGGVRGRSIQLVVTTPETPATDAVATANVSTSTIAGLGGPPAWVPGPLLETLTVTEDILHDDVFSFASPIERQAHLAVAEVFPQPQPGSTAVVVRPASGVFATTVTNAYVRALTARGITAVTVTYEPGRWPAMPSAAAAFVSLSSTDAVAWVEQAAEQRYRPSRGIAGVWTLAQPRLQQDLGEGDRALSPYRLADGHDAAWVHGWVTGAGLVEALRRSGATDAAGLAKALRELSGWESGHAPPYEVRPGTNSRTPEAAPLVIRDHRFVAGEFRRDPS